MCVTQLSRCSVRLNNTVVEHYCTCSKLMFLFNYLQTRVFSESGAMRENRADTSLNFRARSARKIFKGGAPISLFFSLKGGSTFSTLFLGTALLVNRSGSDPFQWKFPIHAILEHNTSQYFYISPRWSQLTLRL